MEKKKSIAMENICIEVFETQKANDLYHSGEWCKPRYSEKRDAWMMTRLSAKMKEE